MPIGNLNFLSPYINITIYQIFRQRLLLPSIGLVCLRAYTEVEGALPSKRREQATMNLAILASLAGRIGHHRRGAQGDQTTVSRDGTKSVPDVASSVGRETDVAERRAADHAEEMRLYLPIGDDEMPA